jgi:hypothetical protein
MHTIHRGSSVSFEEKLENPCPTCFMMMQATEYRRMSSHRLHLPIGFDAQTDKPPPTWF